MNHENKKSSTDDVTAGEPERKLALTAAVAAGLLRLAAIVPNVSPVGALSIYSGARLRGVQSFLIPVALLLLTNFVLGLMYSFPFLNGAIAFALMAFVFNILIGRLLRHTENPLQIGAACLFASIQFFIVTNLGVWATSGYYTLDAAGLSQCFTAALPFLRYTLLGDFFFTAVIFGAHHILAQRYFPEESVAPSLIAVHGSI